MKSFFDRYGVYLVGVALTFIFVVYSYQLTENPPGFYVDESAFAYNAYLIAKTGTSEFGVRWPLFIQNFTPPFTNFVNPVHIYLLAALYVILPPSIFVARALSAVTMFSAGLLLGWLAFKISGKKVIGVIVGLTMLVTPWFFEFARWFSDTTYYPIALVLFLLALERVRQKDKWSWPDAIWIGLTLGLTTYTYTIGRLLGGLLALGLILFAVNRQRIISVAKVWLIFAVTLIPSLIFYIRNPGSLTSRFMMLSYIRTEPTLYDVVVRFITRYFQDLSLYGLLLRGDLNPRHHVPNTTGSILLATVILALIGTVLVFLRQRRDAFWRFILFGTLACVIPGALTNDAFHSARMIAYPVFLLILTIPALQWLFEPTPKRAAKQPGNRYAPLHIVLGVLLAGTLAQAIFFQVKFWQNGYDRPFFLDVTYKDAYDIAIAEPVRPIYLVDGKWGPGYIHALWYATLEGRNTAEFVHLPYQAEPPPGAVVISSAETCRQCQILAKSGQYMVYRKF